MQLFNKSFLTIALSLIAVICFAQTKQDLIANIKRDIQNADNEKSPRVIKLENIEQMTDGGNSLEGFFKNDTLYKIHFWVGLSYGIKEYDYYLNKHEVYFIHEIEKNFKYDNKTGSVVYDNPSLKFEGQYYLHHGTVVYKKLNGKKRFDEKPIISSFNKVQSDIKRYAGLLNNRLKN